MKRGNTVIIPQAVSPVWAERLARAITVQMGCVAAYAIAPMSAQEVRTTAVLHTLSLARDLGDSVKRARHRRDDPIGAILETCPRQSSVPGQDSGRGPTNSRRVDPEAACPSMAWAPMPATVWS